MLGVSISSNASTRLGMTRRISSMSSSTQSKSAGVVEQPD
jgi:hypothetical protein